MLGNQSSQAEQTSSPEPGNLIELTLDDSLNFQLHVDSIVVGGLGVLIAVILFSRLFGVPRRFWKTFEINEAEFGLGDQKSN